MEDQQAPPRCIRRLRNGHACQRDYTEHGDEHRDRQDRTDRAETAGDVVGGHDHYVVSDVGNKQSAECQKANHVPGTGRRP
jgi:hypothetical protein